MYPKLLCNVVQMLPGGEPLADAGQVLQHLLPLLEAAWRPAEAAQRGWISADAKTLYEAGIKATFGGNDTPWQRLWWDVADND